MERASGIARRSEQCRKRISERAVRANGSVPSASIPFFPFKVRWFSSFVFREFCAFLDDEGLVTMDEAMKDGIRACVAAENPQHPFVMKFKFKHFLDKTVRLIYGTAP